MFSARTLGSPAEATATVVHIRRGSQRGFTWFCLTCLLIVLAVSTFASAQCGPGSGDGQRIVFHSDARNLVDSSIAIQQVTNVYLYDVVAEDMQLISARTSCGGSGYGDSRNATISACGRYIAFESYADLFGCSDGTFSDAVVYVYDIETADLSSWDGGNGENTRPTVSRFGRYVAFESTSTDLVDGDTNGVMDIFLRDRGKALVADLTGDGRVGYDDLDILMQNWGDCPCCVADLNNDGVVDSLDYFILANQWTEESCVGLCGYWAYTCSCDPMCCDLEDCCPDYEELCGECEE